MEEGEGDRIYSRDNGYSNYTNYRVNNSRRRQSSSAPSALHVSTLPKIATGRTIHSAKKLWRDHESIETFAALRERSAREYEENRRSVQFSKNPKHLKMSRIREMKPFRIIHSEVFGLSKDKQKEMYSEVTYLTNAVRNCDGRHSFKNLSTHDQLFNSTVDAKRLHWQSANQEVQLKRMLPPAPPGQIGKVFTRDLATLRNDDTKTRKSTISDSFDLEQSSSVDFIQKYRSSDKKIMELDTKEKLRKKRRDDLLKTTRRSSVGTRFVIEHNPDVNLLRNEHLNQNNYEITLKKTPMYYHEHSSRISDNCNNKVHLKQKEQNEAKAQYKRNKTTIPVINVTRNVCQINEHDVKQTFQSLKYMSTSEVTLDDDSKQNVHHSPEANLTSEQNSNTQTNVNYGHAGLERTDNLNTSKTNIVNTSSQLMKSDDPAMEEKQRRTYVWC